MFKRNYGILLITKDTIKTRLTGIKASSKNEVLDWVKDYIGMTKFENADMDWISEKELIVWY